MFVTVPTKTIFKAFVDFVEKVKKTELIAVKRVLEKKGFLMDVINQSKNIEIKNLDIDLTSRIKIGGCGFDCLTSLNGNILKCLTGPDQECEFDI